MKRSPMIQSISSPMSIKSPWISTNMRAMSTTNKFDVHEWTEKFIDAIKEVPKATDPAQSSKALRKLVKTKLLLFTDMANNPEKFFLAHRLLATIGLGGFGVRFTVQFNLFTGSIVGLAGPEQLKMLDEIQEKGQLGCFLLTEMQAGVLSGLIVETTCDWDPNSQEFILHTPNDKAAKNWISQGTISPLILPMLHTSSMKYILTIIYILFCRLHCRIRCRNCGFESEG